MLRRGARVVLALLLALVTLLAPVAERSSGPWRVPAAQAQTVRPPSWRETQRDFDVVNGYYFTEAGGSPSYDQGYSITNTDGVPLWSEFQRLGGVGALGYPVSRRFTWDGFVVQATQKAVLQWRPDLGRAVFVNVFDELSRAGKDDWLLAYRLIPKPAAFPNEAGLSFDQIVQDRLHLLDSYPELRAAYLNDPDPITDNGLPVAPVADVGPALVLRAQRRAFQLWKTAMPFAAPGQVTVVNAGDLAKEAGLFPAEAVQPEPASAQIATPPGSAVQLSSEDVAALRQVVERARPAVVELTDGQTGLGSGIVYDPSGVILTNSHVVTSLDLPKLRAVFPDGRSLPARPLGADDWTDIAVVKVDAPNLPYVSLGASQSLAIGQQVLGLGYAPYFPGAPSAKLGVVRSLSGEIQTEHDYPLFHLIGTTTFLHPGDSGGPLLNLSGQVVGINTAIRIAGRGQELTAFSIPIEGARQVADQLVSQGKVPRPQLGISVQDVTPSLASSAGLPVNRGVLVTQVSPDSPAAAAGIAPGDVIVSMDGQEVAGVDDLRRLMVNHAVGETISLGVVSAGQARRTVQVTLTERPPLV